MIKMGVIGYGYWGPNLVRNFNIAEGAHLTAVCDKSESALKKVISLYNGSLRPTTNADEILSSPDIDAIAIATPVFTHFELAKKALENGKHVFVEKPFTSTVAEAEKLIELADKKFLPSW